MSMIRPSSLLPVPPSPSSLATSEADRPVPVGASDGPRGAGPGALSPLAAQAIKKIRTMGSWSNLGGEIAPYVMTEIPGWPAGRVLRIQAAGGRTVLDTFGADAGTAPPVLVSLDRRQSHYSPIVDDKPKRIPGDGDCFYRAVLIALGDRDRATLYAGLGLRSKVVDEVAIQGLRHAVADQLERESSRYDSRLEMLNLAHFTPVTRSRPPRDRAGDAPGAATQTASTRAAPDDERVVVEAPEDAGDDEGWVLVDRPAARASRR